MRQRLLAYTKPQALYQLSGNMLIPLTVLTVVVMAIGWGWGLGFAPADYQQGDSFRIIYIHVPAAIWSMAVYGIMAIAAFIGVVWQNKLANTAVAVIAPIGAIFTFIALATGAIWAKPMWGTWWVWDVRLTSELILLFLYLGIIALYNTFDDRRKGAQAAAILVLVGIVNLPIIHYSVEWWSTLHQGSTNFHQSIHPSMRTPLRWSIVGYLLFFLTLFIMRLRNMLLFQERSKEWVLQLVNKERA